MSARGRFPSIERWLLRKVYESAGRPPICLILKGGGEVSPSDALPVANLIFSDRGTLMRLILDPEMGFGEAYMQGRLEVEGDFVAVLEAAYQSLSESGRRRWFSRLISGWTALTQSNSLRGSRKNIHHHYDLNTDFYRLWLDPELVYTCAYFPTASATLEEAQAAKVDYVCRKLQLQPGERVVEAGCGWGALALHMASRYGVTVQAFNISHEQIHFARRRAKELGLNRRVEFIEDDYRNISGECDAFVSVGMLEHVGREHYKEVGSVIHRSLTKSGRGLLHFIGRNRPQPLSAWTRKRIFPGAYMPSVREAMEVLEPWDFSVLDIENLRPHYAKTLENWLERFEKSAERVSEMFGPEFVRAWRLYLAGSVAGFRVGTLQLFQVVFARRAWRQIPETRAHLYRDEQDGKQETKWIRAIS
jgi:cyclopropane-fatty-acyl-phospholipid synthase